MIKILKYLSKKDWGYVALSIVFIIVTVYFDLSLPEYMSEITTLVQTEGSRMEEILAAGAWMLLCAFGSLAASFVVAYFASKVAASLSKRLRGLVFDKTLSFSMEEMNRFSTASLITRSTNDVTQIQTLIAMGLQAILKAPVTAVWAITKIMGKSWQWTAVTAGAVAVLMIMICVVIIYAVPRFKTVQKLTDKLNMATRENLTGLRVIRAYNANQYQEDKFETTNKALTGTNLYVNRIMALMQPSMSFLMSMLSLGIYGIGAVLINSAGAGDKLFLFSDMIVFSSYAVQILMSFMMLLMIFILLPRASVSAGRICEVLETAPAIPDGEVTGFETGSKGTIEFKNVGFSYPDGGGNALSHISFTVKQGESVAFIGATGSGKSTLINLIPRFYDVSEGEVLVDGINVKDYSQKHLRDKIGYVSQQATLFRGTVRSNIAYGDNGKAEASECDIIAALEIAQGKDFIEKKPERYDALVSQGGTNFSGGQKQRVSIARAICRKPEILIFDDSFSALDYKTDQRLQKALKEKTKGTTNLIVAQRIGTIKNADTIIVLEEGGIVGMGTHKSLLETCPVYREIALSQLSKEELKHA